MAAGVGRRQKSPQCWGRELGFCSPKFTSCLGSSVTRACCLFLASSLIVLMKYCSTVLF